jgi:predicted transcriptional regulator
MSTTITIRTDEPLRERLEKRAAASGKSLSALIREILENAVTERSVGRRAGHLKGRLSLPGGSSDPWVKAVRERNWRP